MPLQKELPSLRYFAAELGWTPLRVSRHTAKVDAELLRIVWYESGDWGNPRTDCFLFISEIEIGRPRYYKAAVYALRYRLFSFFHCFKLKSTKAGIAQEAARLQHWLGKSNFDSRPRRAVFRALHPECAGFSWKRTRELGPDSRAIEP